MDRNRKREQRPRSNCDGRGQPVVRGSMRRSSGGRIALPGQRVTTNLVACSMAIARVPSASTSSASTICCSQKKTLAAGALSSHDQTRSVTGRFHIFSVPNSHGGCHTSCRRRDKRITSHAKGGRRLSRNVQVTRQRNAATQHEAMQHTYHDEQGSPTHSNKVDRLTSRCCRSLSSPLSFLLVFRGGAQPLPPATTFVVGSPAKK